MKGSFFLLLSVPLARAAYKGFNYAALDANGGGQDQAAFESAFTAANTLPGVRVPYSSARLYTSIQGGTTNDPIQAIPAAIQTQTSLLLGIWVSAGQTTVDNEIAAIRTAVDQYGASFTDLIAGISVGSEDVYRSTPRGMASNAGPGVDPATVREYVVQVQNALRGLDKPIGHVDTYDVWTNASGWMDEVRAAVDFVGMNAFPYYEDSKTNTIHDAGAIFWHDGYNTTMTMSIDRPVWITETGWPSSGPQVGQAVASTDNAAQYYRNVACRAFQSDINTWWYMLQDTSADPSAPSFGVVGSDMPLPTAPKFNLTCS